MAIKSIFNFGKKRRSTKRKVSKQRTKTKKNIKKNTPKLPKKLLSICKSLKVKVYTVRKGKRVKKSLKTLKTQCLKKVNALIKLHKRKAKFGIQNVYRPKGSLMFGKSRTGRSRFGRNYSPYFNDPSFGYSRVIPQVPGVRTQAAAPGVNSEFFESQVPKPLPPNWPYPQGPTGPATPLGYPFQQSSTKFGRRQLMNKDY